MEIRVLEVSEMKLLRRKKVKFEIGRQSQSTPSIWDTRNALAAVGGFKPEGLVIVSINDRSGSDASEGVAHSYETEEEMKEWEPKHIILANMEPQARKSAMAEMKKRRTEAKAAKTGVKK